MLVVEDEPIIGLDLVTIAEGLGFHVYGPATNKAAALLLASAHPPDIAIVDVNLTDGPTGPSIAAYLTETFATAVLIVTANPEAVTQGQKGASAILTKPFDDGEIEAALSSLSDDRAHKARSTRF